MSKHTGINLECQVGITYTPFSIVASCYGDKHVVHACSTCSGYGTHNVVCACMYMYM